MSKRSMEEIQNQEVRDIFALAGMAMLVLGGTFVVMSALCGVGTFFLLTNVAHAALTPVMAGVVSGFAGVVGGAGSTVGLYSYVTG